MPEFGRDDCWLFVFQYSFAFQGGKLAEKYTKNACIFFNAICAELLRKFKMHILDKNLKPMFYKLCRTDFRKEDSIFLIVFCKKKIWLKTEIYFHLAKFLAQFDNISSKNHFLEIFTKIPDVRPSFIVQCSMG